MTDIYLDNSKIDFEDTERDATVGELLTEIDSELKAGRRFVTKLLIDGEEQTDFRSDSVTSQLILGCKELKLFSDTVEAIALNGVDVIERYLNVVLENIDQSVKAFRAGGAEVGASSVIVIDGMTEIAKTMHELTKGGQNYDITVFRADPTPYYERILESLEALNKAKDSMDSILMADTLEYELRELVVEMLGALFTEKGS
ncbi:MAG: hypothetical protein IME99_08955 [Proteobacteria bacterium]|nr:hypothetical protein [Pseudomonadota bacterium]